MGALGKGGGRGEGGGVVYIEDHTILVLGSSIDNLHTSPKYYLEIKAKCT